MRAASARRRIRWVRRVQMLFALAVAAISGQVQNEGTLCHGKCLNPRYESTGDCPSGFCGSGACCQRGSVKPPCNGISMGCEGFK
jgi:hypothetical protein